MNAPLFRLASLIAALCCLSAIAGCTALRLTYPQADIVLGWRANTYFDLDREQRRDFSVRLERLLAWHRYDQLPEYAKFLTDIIDKAGHGVKPEDIAWLVDGFRARYRVIVNRGAKDAAEVLATLTPEQIAHLQKQFEKDNKKFASEHELDGSTEKRKRARLKKTLSQIEDWTGHLNHEQEARIAALIDPLPLIEHMRQRDRMRRQQEFVELLNHRQAKLEFAGRLHQWLLDWDQRRSPEYVALSAQVFEQRLHFYTAVDKLLTGDQRQHALARLQKFVDDCRKLSARPAGHAGAAGAQAAILALF